MGKGTNRCEAMRIAGVDDPESQEGIDFCVNQCPYNDDCIAMTPVVEGMYVTTVLRANTAKELMRRGMSHEDIAKTMGVTTKTVYRLLEIG